MSLARSLRHASRRELRERLLAGHPVDPAALEGFAYRGTALGMPGFVERLSWKTFQKTFWRHDDGRLLGWNVRLHQDGVDAPSRPIEKGGEPWCTWFYEVVPGGVPAPTGFDRGLFIDYARGPNPRLDVIRWVKDPLVALAPGDADALMGVSYAVIGGRCLTTPTWFTLERDHAITHVPSVLR